MFPDSIYHALKTTVKTQDFLMLWNVWKRPNYVFLSEELKNVCDENDCRKFNPSEWLSPSHLREVFNKEQEMSS